ncbi:MAG: hypothetical protein RLZZ50_1763 [Verrucomicrobiota bacterium]
MTQTAPQILGLVSIGSMDIALPADLIETIVRGPLDLTPFPKAAPHVLGAFAFGGEALPVVDFATLLSPQSEKLPAPIAFAVIIRHPGGRFAVPIDAVRGMVRADADRLTDLEPGSPQRAGLFSRLYTPERGGRVAVVLDLDLVLSVDGLRSALKAPRRDSDRTRTTNDTARPHVLFRAGGASLALDARQACLIERAPSTPASPLSHPVLRGFHPLRGKTLPVVNTAALLGLPESPKRPALLFVVGDERRSVALEIDSIDGMTRLDPATIGTALARELARPGLFSGACTTETGKVTLVLEPHALLDAACLVDSEELFTTETAEAARSQAGAARPYLVYRAAGGALATPMAELEAVFRLPEDYTDLRGGPDPATVGIACWQGSAVKIVDLGALIGRPAENTGPGSPILVTGGKDGLVGYLVDRLELSRHARPQALPRLGDRRFGNLPPLLEQIRVRENTRDIAACVLHLSGSAHHSHAAKSAPAETLA